jgi:hypothetical protein
MRAHRDHEVPGAGQARRDHRHRPATPAAGNERVTVSRRLPRGSRWEHQTVRVAASGTSTTSWRMPRGTSTFVAQRAGDFRSRGDGWPVLTVRVGR